jgi:DNA primase
MRTEIQILEEVLGDYVRSGQKEYSFFCPFCEHHKKKLAVRLDKGYHCWVCDTSGKDVGHLVNLFGSFEARHEWTDLTGKIELTEFDKLFYPIKEIEKEEVVELPKEFISLSNGAFDEESRKAINYLYYRGISDKDILKWKIGFCPSGPYHQRIIIPSFSTTGNVNFFVARSYSNDWMRYKNPSISKDIIFNELYVEWDRPIVLVEGVFDAIKATNAVPILGSTLKEETKLFQKIVNNNLPVYLALDPDASKKTKEILRKLLSYGVEVFMINVDGYDDIGEMNKETFEERFKAASFLNNKDYLVSAIMCA